MTNRRRYDPAVRTAGGNRARLRAQASSVDPALLHRMAVAAAELACAEGRHRTETDPVTGDEVCRHCRTVIQ